MAKIRLLDDNAWGDLLRIALGFVEPVDGEARILTPHKNIELYTRRRSALTLLASAHSHKRLFDIKTTVSPITVSKLRESAKFYKQKAAASMVGPGNSRSIGLLNAIATKIENLAQHISKTYKGPDEKITPQDLERLSEFPTVLETLHDRLVTSTKQLPNLKEFVGKYQTAYANRALLGQEHLPLADFLARPILEKMNSRAFLERNGIDNVVISGVGTQWFCHSVSHLHYKGDIVLLNLRGDREYPYRWKATVDNLSLKKPQGIGVGDQAAANLAHFALIKSRINRQRGDTRKVGGNKKEEVEKKGDLGKQGSEGKLYCSADGVWGYIRRNRSGERIRIGNKRARKYRLLCCLLEPINTFRTADTVFEAVRQDKDKNDPLLQSPTTAHRRKVTLIESAIDELQRGRKISNTLKIEWNEEKTQLRAAPL